MTNPIEPVTAWAAVDPQGNALWQVMGEDEDSAMFSLFALKGCLGIPAQPLSAGWTIRQVEIRVKEEG